MKKWVAASMVLVLLSLICVFQVSAGAVLDGIKQKGTLTVGLTGNQLPLNATTKEGKIIGLDADIARLIARNMGVKVEFQKMPFPELLPALAAGKVDMLISGMTMTLERNMQVAFIGPYYVSGKGILTKTQMIASLQDGEGLNKPEFRVAALQNSTSQEFVTATAPKAQLVKVQSYDQAVEMLLQDQINALVADYPFCAVTAFRYQDEGLTAGQSRLTFEPLGIAVREDALLVNWLRNFLIMLDGSGELKRLTEKWFEDGSWLQQLP